MENYQTKVIEAQVNLLWHLRETHENELTPIQIDWIDDDITYVEVKYLGIEDDSTRAAEFRDEEHKSIDFVDALNLLSVRIENTVKYLEC